ncbi:hypothetical protein IX55_10740, partial [Paracoccus sanguinis]
MGMAPGGLDGVPGQQQPVAGGALGLLPLARHRREAHLLERRLAPGLGRGLGFGRLVRAEGRSGLAHDARPGRRAGRI